MQQWRLNAAVTQGVIVFFSLAALAVHAQHVVGINDDLAREYLDNLIAANEHAYAKRDFDGNMPGVLRFGKRSEWFDEEQGRIKKQVPGVLRFGKRSTNEKKSVPGVLRFGKRDDIPGVLRFGKRDVPGVLRFGKRDDIPGVLRFGKRSVDFAEDMGEGNIVFKKSVPGLLRFGRK